MWYGKETERCDMGRRKRGCDMGEERGCGMRRRQRGVVMGGDKHPHILAVLIQSPFYTGAQAKHMTAIHLLEQCRMSQPGEEVASSGLGKR